MRWLPFRRLRFAPKPPARLRPKVRFRRPCCVSGDVHPRRCDDALADALRVLRHAATQRVSTGHHGPQTVALRHKNSIKDTVEWAECSFEKCAPAPSVVWQRSEVALSARRWLVPGCVERCRRYASNFARHWTSNGWHHTGRVRSPHRRTAYTPERRLVKRCNTHSSVCRRASNGRRESGRSQLEQERSPTASSSVAPAIPKRTSAQFIAIIYIYSH